MFGSFINNEKVKFTIKSELLSQKNHFDQHSTIISTLLKSYNNASLTLADYWQIADKKRDCMVSRFKFDDCNKTVDTFLPSRYDIFDLLIQSKSTCANSGVTGIWRSGGSRILNPLFLTWDHKIPVSKGGSNDIDNLQVVLNFVNQLKGNQSNFRVRKVFNRIYKK
jgi:hypothetical protein